MSYVVATIKPWNIKVFKTMISKYSGKWTLISEPEKLTLKNLRALKTKMIFFPHWSEKIPTEILNEFECIGFHETDLPYGRGGSPIQNLVLEGKKKQSKISAIRLEEGWDTGAIYLKESISLAGTAQEIFERNAKVVGRMIKKIVQTKPAPKAQKGKAHVFKRRKPEQSNLLAQDFKTMEELYDFIRILDAETYPHAFVELGNWRAEFASAKKKGNDLMCQVTFKKNESKK